MATDPAFRLPLAKAYATQSQSDYAVYELLASVEECHRLHYLQMACEKIAKAYRLRDTQAPLEEALTSHVAFSKFVDNLLASPQIRQRYQSRGAKLREAGHTAHALAREIEKLAPAVDRNRSPINAEYPWISGSDVVVPCLYTYPNLRLLTEPGGREFLKLLKTAIEDFNTIHIHG